MEDGLHADPQALAMPIEWGRVLWSVAGNRVRGGREQGFNDLVAEDEQGGERFHTARNGLVAAGAANAAKEVFAAKLLEVVRRVSRPVSAGRRPAQLPDAMGDVEVEKPRGERASRAISADILDFRARVLAIHGGNRRSWTATLIPDTVLPVSSWDARSGAPGGRLQSAERTRPVVGRAVSRGWSCGRACGRVRRHRVPGAEVNLVRRLVRGTPDVEARGCRRADKSPRAGRRDARAAERTSARLGDLLLERREGREDLVGHAVLRGRNGDRAQERERAVSPTLKCGH